MKVKRFSENRNTRIEFDNRFDDASEVLNIKIDFYPTIEVYYQIEQIVIEYDNGNLQLIYNDLIENYESFKVYAEKYLQISHWDKKEEYFNNTYLSDEDLTRCIKEKNKNVENVWYLLYEY